MELESNFEASKQHLLGYIHTTTTRTTITNTQFEIDVILLFLPRHSRKITIKEHKVHLPSLKAYS